MSALDERKLRWLPILLEAFFVVLGVVLALAANEWREHLNQKQHAATALASIRNELASNRQAVVSALTYHLHLVDTLATFVGRSPQAQSSASAYPDNRLFSRGYIAPATLLNTAWEAANATDALAHMDYDAVLLLSRIYEEQRTYEYQARQGGQLIYEKLFSEGHEGVRRNFANLSMTISSFWYRECELLQSYGRVMAHLDGAGEPSLEALPAACRRVLRR
jgi:hypothetical protein